MTCGVFGVDHQTNIRQKVVRFQLILRERKVVVHELVEKQKISMVAGA